MKKQNIILIVVESLRYDRLFGSHIPTEYKMSKFLELASDSTVFHKCISVSNSSWMSAAAILMGNDKCYHHNNEFYWQIPFDCMTVYNTYSNPLFYELEENGFQPSAYFCPNTQFGLENSRDILHHVLDQSNVEKVNTIWGSRSENIHYCEDKNDIAQSVISTFEKNDRRESLASFIWAHDDHIAFTPGGPMARLECYVETSDKLGLIFEYLKETDQYDNTDIYIIGDHGDSYFAFSEASPDTSLQHGITPFHTTTHVPLVVKSQYLNKEQRYDLVSNIDLYSTILNSLEIDYKTNNLNKNCSSIDLVSKDRDFVVSQNRFINQPSLVDIDGAVGIMSGIAITKGDYVYVINDHGEYFFNHIIDPLNVSNLFRGNNIITGSHQHVQNWFDKKVMDDINGEILSDMKTILLSLSEEGFVRKDLL